MNRTLILLIIILAFGCKSETKNNLDELKSDKKNKKTSSETIKTKVFLDTLVFDKFMVGESLTEKYLFGLEQLEYYKQFISENKINEKQITIDEEYGIKTENIYLGQLMDLNKLNKYHVIREFKILGIEKMQSPRGVSNVAFINDNFEKAIIYRMNLPNELPKRIEDDILYFNMESQKIGISILGGLPPLLCVPKIGCN